MKFLLTGLTAFLLALSGASAAIVEGSRILQEVNSNCKEVDENGKCTSCYFRSFLKNGNCEVVNGLCKFWNDSGDCTDCYLGYSLSNGACLVSPPSQQPSGSGAMIIQNLDSLCVTGDSNGNCAICSYRSVLQNGKCVLVNGLCQTWDDTAACTSCYAGYKLELGACK